MLRLRSDEQLVSVFRAGNDEAFRVIHDRYRARMFAYTRQMLGGSPQDPEDAVQEIFVRAYAGLRANHRELALRPWLYRIAHNRCVDELRRPHAIALETIDSVVAAVHDPVTKAEQRDSLRRLIIDVQRLPEQQRSALLMREMGGMAYADVAGALGVSVPAVKSLLVRARLGLAQANEARDTACAEIREDLIASHDRGVRASGLARRHMRDCASCREFRAEVRGVSRRFAALTPTLGPLGVLANLLGWGSGGGAAAGSGAMAGGSTAAAGTGAAASASASAGVLAGGAGHVVTLLAAAVVATGGAVEIQHTLGAPGSHRTHAHRVAARQPTTAPITSSTPSSTLSSGSSSKHATTTAPADNPGAAAPASASARVAPPRPHAQPGSTSATPTSGRSSSHGKSDPTKTMPISETLDPDNMMYGPNGTNGTTSATGSTGAGSTSTTAGSSTGATTATGSTSATGTPAASGATTGTGAGGSATSGGTTPSTTGSTPTSGGQPGSGTAGAGAASGGAGTAGGGFGATTGGSGAASTSAGSSSPSSAGAGSLSSFEQTQ